MKKKVVLIYETDINYNALDLAIAACKKWETDLEVIFIYAEKDEKPGYGFPSDLSLAQTVTDEKDIWQDDTALILQEAKLIHEKAGFENIVVAIAAYKKLSVATLQKKVDEAVEVYVDASMNKNVIHEGEHFSINNIQVTTTCPVVLVMKK